MRDTLKLHPQIFSRILILLSLLFVCGYAAASEIQNDFQSVNSFFPQADRVGDLEGEPRSATVKSKASTFSLALSSKKST